MNSKELTAEILETIKDLRWNNADQKMIFNAVKNLIDTNIVVNKNDLLPDVMHHVCPDCEGRKYFPDKKSTSGQKPCNRCWGTGQIVP